MSDKAYLWVVEAKEGKEWVSAYSLNFNCAKESRREARAQARWLRSFGHCVRVVKYVREGK